MNTQISNTEWAIIFYFRKMTMRSYNSSLYHNESTTGADASVEMPKLHNIKLLIAFIMINNLILLHAKTRRVGNDRP